MDVLRRRYGESSEQGKSALKELNDWILKFAPDTVDGPSIDETDGESSDESEEAPDKKFLMDKLLTTKTEIV